jgi:hypothetical protein
VDPSDQLNSVFKETRNTIVPKAQVDLISEFEKRLMTQDGKPRPSKITLGTSPTREAKKYNQNFAASKSKVLVHKRFLDGTQLVAQNNGSEVEVQGATAAEDVGLDSGNKWSRQPETFNWLNSDLPPPDPTTERDDQLNDQSIRIMQANDPSKTHGSPFNNTILNKSVQNNLMQSSLCKDTSTGTSN